MACFELWRHGEQGYRDYDQHGRLYFQELYVEDRGEFLDRPEQGNAAVCADRCAILRYDQQPPGGIPDGGRSAVEYDHGIYCARVVPELQGYCRSCDPDLQRGFDDRPGQGKLAGQCKVQDINGDGKIDQNDRTIIGNPWPK